MAEDKAIRDAAIRVLLVDDEEDLNEYLAKRLRLEGFAVAAATSGPGAIDLASRADYDVAIVDLKMPGMDGIETQQRLKQLRPFLQTIVLTGHGSVDAALQSGRHQAFRFLAKPADHAALLEAIRKAAALKREQVSDAFRKEMEAVATGGGSPREIKERIDALRKKYGLPS